jgi:hypothetical protein
MEFEEAAFRQSDNTKTAPAPHVAPSRRRRGTLVPSLAIAHTKHVLKVLFSCRQNMTNFRQE